MASIHKGIITSQTWEKMHYYSLEKISLFFRLFRLVEIPLPITSLLIEKGDFAKISSFCTIVLKEANNTPHPTPPEEAQITHSRSKVVWGERGADRHCDNNNYYFSNSEREISASTIVPRIVWAEKKASATWYYWGLVDFSSYDINYFKSKTCTRWIILKVKWSAFQMIVEKTK